jgi:hypothetical protein
VLKENGKRVDSGKVKGISVDDKGNTIVLAGSYNFTLE